MSFELTIAIQSATAVAVVPCFAIPAESADAEVSGRHAVGSAHDYSSAVQFGLPSPVQAYWDNFPDSFWHRKPNRCMSTQTRLNEINSSNK